MLFYNVESILYALISTGTALLGAFIAYIFHPRQLLLSFLFHLAAGILVAAVAVEFIPKIIDTGDALRLGTSFLAGAVTIVSIRAIFAKLENFSTFSRVVATLLTLLIHGILIAIAFYVAEKTGIVIALSLSLFALLLNFSIAGKIQEKGWQRSMQIATLVVIACMPPVGAWLGNYLLYGTVHFLRLEILAFGAAVLLYLGAEELLGTVQKKGSWLLSMAFLIGFVSLLFFI